MKSEVESGLNRKTVRVDNTVKRNRAGLMAIYLLFGTFFCHAQQMYDNGENTTEVTYATHPSGRVEAFVPNPSPDSVNPSPRCAKFRRNRVRYDYIKVNPSNKLEDVSAYASYDEAAPKMRMKVFTTAPAGTVVELQLGRNAASAYPEGTHSQYQATTTVSGQWEEIEFRFVEIPKGSRTQAKEVDQVTLLFMPGTSETHTFYFDEIRGPAVAETRSAKLFRKR